MVIKSSRLAMILLLVGPTVAVSAAEPAAIIQSVQGSGTSLEAMEIIERGRVFDLGADGRLVLGYLRSCIHEEITGGRVTVGARRSVVEGGRISRRRVECDGGAFDLTPAQAGKSSALIFRHPPNGLRRVVIHRTNPMTDVPGEDVVYGR